MTENEMPNDGLNTKAGKEIIQNKKFPSSSFFSSFSLATWLKRLFVFYLLTLVTQIGGIIYVLCLPLFRFAENLGLSRTWFSVMRVFIFSLFYALITFYLVPIVAESYGRVPMPYGDENPVMREHNFLTVLLNRRYVVNNLRSLIEVAAQKTAKQYPGTVTEYLDCGFPFGNDYVMQPHISHNDGRKIDISFFYFETETKQRSNERPSWLGYGACEVPRPGEQDQPTYCAQKGNWQYSFLKRITHVNKNLSFDAPRTRDFALSLLSDNRLQSIMIEPHLQTRLGLQKSIKLKSPPCISVRHDDHIHVTIY
jgi:hypothetical protein